MLRRRHLLWAVMVGLALVPSGCESLAGRPAALTLLPSDCNIGVGEAFRLRWVLSDIHGLFVESDTGDVGFESSDPSIAAVDETGRVTGLSCGEAVITATYLRDPSIWAICAVHVRAL